MQGDGGINQQMDFTCTATKQLLKSNISVTLALPLPLSHPQSVNQPVLSAVTHVSLLDSMSLMQCVWCSGRPSRGSNSGGDPAPTGRNSGKGLRHFSMKVGPVHQFLQNIPSDAITQLGIAHGLPQYSWPFLVQFDMNQL